MKLWEYIAEKMSGAYGDDKHRLKAFASRISPVHMHAALGANTAQAADGRRYSLALSMAAASRPSKVEPGSENRSSQS